MRLSPSGPGRSGMSVAAAAVLLGLVVPSAVLAHAELDTVTPADKSTVDVAPTEVVMTFTEDLDPSKSSIVVVTSAGSQVASGGQVDATDQKKMTLALPELQPGAYEIRWTSTSAEDGDIARGVTTFTFTPAPTPSPTPTLAPSATPAPTATPTSSPSLAPAPSPSGAGTQTASSTDVLIPIVVGVILVAALGYWLLRGRSRAGGPS